jgi:hypothetical protein
MQSSLIYCLETVRAKIPKINPNLPSVPRIFVLEIQKDQVRLMVLNTTVNNISVISWW